MPFLIVIMTCLLVPRYWVGVPLTHRPRSQKTSGTWLLGIGKDWTITAQCGGALEDLTVSTFFPILKGLHRHLPELGSWQLHTISNHVHFKMWQARLASWCCSNTGWRAMVLIHRLFLSILCTFCPAFFCTRPCKYWTNHDQPPSKIIKHIRFQAFPIRLPRELCAQDIAWRIHATGTAVQLVCWHISRDAQKKWFSYDLDQFRCSELIIPESSWIFLSLRV